MENKCFYKPKDMDNGLRILESNTLYEVYYFERITDLINAVNTFIKNMKS